MSATGYFKVLCRVSPVRQIDLVVPFDGRDVDSIAMAWARVLDMATEVRASGVVRWGSTQVQGPWSSVRRIDA